MKVISPWDMTETNLRNEILSGKNQRRQKFDKHALNLSIFLALTYLNPNQINHEYIQKYFPYSATSP